MWSRWAGLPLYFWIMTFHVSEFIIIMHQEHWVGTLDANKEYIAANNSLKIFVPSKYLEILSFKSGIFL